MSVDENKGESVRDIFSLALTKLAQQNKQAYDLLLQKADEGFFEQHQTKGTIKKLAAQLIDTKELSEN